MRSLALLAAMMLSLSFGAARASTAPSTARVDDAQAAVLADRVKAEFLHAWLGYRKYAWGHDELMPLSRKPRDWYGESLLMTPVDALDTLVLMGLTDQADAARELIATKLDFDRDIYVKHFEVTIRLLGGLLSGYQLTGDKRLLLLADDLGTRLLPAFDSPTGLPYVEVNLRSGKTRNTDTNPAESGTLLLEFGTLAKLTGKPHYYDKAKRALVAVYERRSKLGLVGERLDTRTGQWTNTDSHVGARIDSYYEYLWKCWTLFGDRDCRAMWEASAPAMHRYLADEVDGALWYGQADMHSGKRSGTQYGALDAFLPALLVQAGDVERARRLQESSFRMWNLAGIEPEAIDYRRMKIVHAGYPLRPEIVESAFFLHRATGDSRWRVMGKALFEDFVEHCRSEVGYAALADVVAKKKKDNMESFVLAETFKYYWLLFSPLAALDLDRNVFNTEAHPLRPTWREGEKQGTTKRR